MSLKEKFLTRRAQNINKNGKENSHERTVARLLRARRALVDGRITLPEASRQFHALKSTILVSMH